MIVPEPIATSPTPARLPEAEAIAFGDRGRRRGLATALRAADLTLREREILVMVARGHSNGEAADHLDLSIETVKSHMRRVLSKLDARNRCHAVALAYEHGILRPERRPRPEDRR